MPRLPLACSIETRDGSLAKDSKLVNCFVDIEGKSAFVVKRPGLSKSVAATAGAALGMISWEGKMYYAIGSSIYQTAYASIPSSGGDESSVSETVMASLSSFYSLTMAKIGTTLYMINEDSGYLMSSADNGATWGNITSTTPGWSGLCPVSASIGLFSDGTYLYGVDSVNTTNVFKSLNGVAWTDTGSPPNISITSGQIIWDGSRFVYFKDHIYTSTNFVSWTDQGVGASGFETVVYMAGKYWQAGSGSINYSSALPTWTAVNGKPWSANSVVYTDGTNLMVLDFNLSGGFTAYTVNTSTFAATVIGTNATMSYPMGTYSHELYKYGYAISGSLYVSINTGVSSAKVEKITITSGPSYGSPDYTYAFTTVTPGLPLSWVGTSPGASVKRMFIKNTEKAWTLTLGSPGTLTQVTDPDYPAVTVPGAVYLDGYFFVMDKDGTVYNCDLENPTSWNSLNYISAEAEWDAGVAIAKHQNYVVALKDWTTELFYDAANPTGSPLQRLANAALQIGCAQGYSVVQFHGGLIFMSKTREKGRSVHFFPSDSVAPQEIASAAVQRVLNKADLTSVKAWGGKLGGRTLYVLNLVTANITLVYDFTTKLWQQFTSDVSGTEGYFKYGYYATDGNRDFLLHETSGEVFSFTPDSYKDETADIKVLIRTGRTDSGNLDRKIMPTLEVVGDKQTTTLTISVSDDDYQNFTALDSVSMDDDPPRLRRLGAYVRRSFDIRHVDNTPLRLLALDAEIKQMR